MAGRADLTEYEYRKIRARVLVESDVCIVCGHGASDAVTPVSRGGARKDPDNLAPIHGVLGCSTCGRKRNNENGDEPLSAVTRLSPHATGTPDLERISPLDLR